MTLANDASIHGLTVGQGAGSVSTNTAVGASALAVNSSGTNNTGFGNGALSANTSGGANTSVGDRALATSTTASFNAAIGVFAGRFITGSYNTALGSYAYQGDSGGTSSGANNTAVGYQSLYSNTTASNNTAVGYGAGYNITTGSKNTILGSYNGNQGGLDIRTSSNYIVLSDGDGNPRGIFDASGNLLVGTTSSNGRITSDGTSNSSNQAVWAKNIDATGTAATYVAWNAATTGNPIFVDFYTETSATRRGTISYNRGAGLVAYNVTSDYRAKDIYGPVVDSGALIDSVPVYMGKMKGATQERPMFIAHETPDYAHTGEKDAVDKDGNPVYQQMDASALIPVMWAEIQSLRARLKAANIA